MNEKKLRGAVIGYGFISAMGHVPGYLKRSADLDDVEIVAIADICPARRNLARESLPHAAIYNDYRELLKANATNLDFVDICTPPCEHAAIAHAALARRVHVLCEKPLSCTLAEAHSLLSHAKAAQRVLFPCHNYKHAPIVKTITEIIKAGGIGKVRSVSIEIYRSTHARGVAEWNAHWRRQSRYSGGGIAMDHGSHSFYLTFDWLGSYPVSITAAVGNLKPEKYDTEDEFTATLVFPSGSARVHLTWTSGMRKAIYVVEGEKGSITMENDDLVIETWNGTGLAEIEKRSMPSDSGDASHAAWFNPLFNEFRTAIDCSDYAGREAQEALLCVQLINMAYRSAEQGSRELPLAHVLRD